RRPCEEITGGGPFELAHAPVGLGSRGLGGASGAQLPCRVDVLDGRIVSPLGSAPELAASRELVEPVLRRAFCQRHRAHRQRAQAFLGEIGAVGEPEPPRRHHAQAHALARRLLQLLDVSLAHLDRRLARPLGVRLGLARARLPGQRHQLLADVGEGRVAPSPRGRRLGLHAHAPVPPTVTSSIRTVGRPTPTGTLWPSFPQVPSPGSNDASEPTALTCLSASGPTPMSMAPLTGRVISPCSIRYASEISKTKLPFEM